MKLLVKKQSKGTTKRKQNSIITINKTTISFSKETLNIYGLKNHLYFGIGSRSDGSLIAIFSEYSNAGFNKINHSNQRTRSSFIVITGENKRNMNRYLGDYRIKAEVDLMEGCICYVLRPLK